MIHSILEESRRPSQSLGTKPILSAVVADCVANEVDCALAYTECLNGALSLLLNEHQAFLGQKKRGLEAAQTDKPPGECQEKERAQLVELSQCLRSSLEVYQKLRMEHEGCLASMARTQKELAGLHQENKGLQQAVELLKKVLRESKRKVEDHARESARCVGRKAKEVRDLQESYDACEKDLEEALRALGKARENLRRAEDEKEILQRALGEKQREFWTNQSVPVKSELHQRVCLAEQTKACHWAKIGLA